MSAIKDLKINSSEEVAETSEKQIEGFPLLNATLQLYTDKEVDLKSDDQKNLGKIQYRSMTDITATRGVLAKEFAIGMVSLVKHFLKYFPNEQARNNVKQVILDTLTKEV